MTPAPAISVLMPVFNAGEFLQEAIRSLDEQTFKDFEVVAVDNNSTDNSVEILKAAAKAHPRFEVIHEPTPGVVAALNAGWSHCRGEFVARIDADDIALPRRFAEQLRVMRADPAISVCGSAFERFGQSAGLVCPPVHHEEIKARLLFGSPLAHPSTLLRRSIVGRESPYRKEFEGVEDYELWVRLAAGGVRFKNLSEPLLRYRIHPRQVTSRSDIEGRAAKLRRVWDQLFQVLRLTVVEDHSRAQAQCGFEDPPPPAASLSQVDQWLIQLMRHARSRGWSSAEALRAEGEHAWWRAACRRSHERETARCYVKGRFAPWSARTVIRAIRLFRQSRKFATQAKTTQ